MIKIYFPPSAEALCRVELLPNLRGYLRGRGTPPHGVCTAPAPRCGVGERGGGWVRAIYGRALLCVCIPPPGRDAPKGTIAAG